jgi:hypothetical protein
MNQTFNPFPIPNNPQSSGPVNPLKQYFRQPAIYVKLPSGGEFYPPGSIEMTPTKELPVYPMTAIDEITYRTPDALFNGQAVVNVIQSCIPNIKNAWVIPSMDVDTILVAIRMASYGHEMEFDSTCPKCNDQTEHTLDLRTVLDKMRSPDYTKSVTQGDMQIYFKPMSYKNLTDNNKMQFEQQKILRIVPQDSESEDAELEKTMALSKAMIKITEMTVKAIAQSISQIKTPQAMVSELNFIEEFLQNCDRKLFDKIQQHIIDIKTQAELQPLGMTCEVPECKHEYDQPITLDMSNFFGAAS